VPPGAGSVSRDFAIKARRVNRKLRRHIDGRTRINRGTRGFEGEQADRTGGLGKAEKERLGQKGMGQFVKEK